MASKDRSQSPEPNEENKRALGQAVPLIYAELRRLAAHYMGQERGYHTLQSTALVHEAYLRLAEQRGVEWKNREQFVGIAAQLMRRILVDHARRLQASKRGGDVEKVFVEEATIVAKQRGPDVVALDEALTKLAELDPQQARLVELRFFGGLTIQEAAGVLQISPATAKRNWSVAKAWLARALRHEQDPHA